MFSRLVEWVTSSGGLVHPSLELDAQRSLRIQHATIPAGTLLMRIPVISAPPTNNMPPSTMDPMEDALAWYLARKPMEIQRYLASLPDECDLPRTWPQSTVLEPLLTGSPVLNYIQKTADQLKSQYQVVKEHYEAPKIDANAHSEEIPPFPISWEDYSHAHALVTSRAFSEDAPVMKESSHPSLYMVPVLDLCNHCRGGTHEQSGGSKKNVSYTFRKRLSDAPKASIMIEVTSTNEIVPGEAIRITYGAKSNAVLLANYGFTLAHNREPDGSSNDVLEFVDGSGETVTTLRTGPPSYTYGCFTTALQYFCNAPKAPLERSDQLLSNENDDLEDFLNECEAEESDGNEEEEESHTPFDELYEDTTNGVPKNTNRLDEEVKALGKFRQHLQDLADAYTLPKQPHWSSLLSLEQSPSRDVYAARLIFSELRVLQFYTGATMALEGRLRGLELPHAVPLVTLPPDDVRNMDRHVDDLVTVYMQLRH